jgi:hypothetical protein
VLYTSSFFGDELWPADKLGFTKTAIQAKPDSVYFVVSRCAPVLPPLTVSMVNFFRDLKLAILLSLNSRKLLIFWKMEWVSIDPHIFTQIVILYDDNRGGGTVDVKRLPKRPAPPRFGRKLSDSQKVRSRESWLLHSSSRP